ncbi:AI-2E family transporter [Roseivirga misakiensis]|uniref:AI-2E family transporter n=1 Tax=Roseivirga misakiensis TaxID=1563681 RepID=A0A1E5SKV9_9BACT|nr:AI-2E family transporter [Roseivirga misakiensis]OEJ99759.1 AI-2E family transporter [Roseivirga misakiensis]
MNDRKTTNILLLIIVIPLVFFLFKTLSFILIPFVSSMFIALLFLPLMRWLKSKGCPKVLSLIIVVLIIATFFKLSGELIQLSSKEILSKDNAFLDQAKVKLSGLLYSIESFFGVDFLQGEDTLASFINQETISKNFAPTVGFISNTLTMTLTTAFFVLLLLAGSIDIQKILRITVLKQQFSSIKTFMKIEKDLITFIKVKFFISLFTGLGIGVSCWAFGVSFPIFWGLFAFAINFLQMVGSVISVVLLAVFSFVEIETTSILFFFVATITGVQVLFGGILEPIFMGKSFSINVITILIMLMLWGYVWGIPGLIMSIPITVFIKILLEQFESTKVIARLISGNNEGIKVKIGKL